MIKWRQGPLPDHSNRKRGLFIFSPLHMPKSASGHHQWLREIKQLKGIQHPSNTTQVLSLTESPRPYSDFVTFLKIIHRSVQTKKKYINLIVLVSNAHGNVFFMPVLQLNARVISGNNASNTGTPLARVNSCCRKKGKTFDSALINLIRKSFRKIRCFILFFSFGRNFTL